MTNEELNNALYEKAEKEQDAYREWLLEQEPREILDHAYEYATREDILMSLENSGLPDDKAEALLNSSGVMDDIYRAWEKMETEHMDDIRLAAADAAGRAAERQENRQRPRRMFR